MIYRGQTGEYDRKSSRILHVLGDGIKAWSMTRLLFSPMLATGGHG